VADQKGTVVTYREPTVADLITQLSELPQHYPVAPMVNGTVGVITGVWCVLLAPGTQETPTVLIGEHMPADAIVPPEWAKPAAPEPPECNWPRCHRKPNPCFAWCKCQCHTKPTARDEQTGRGGVA
jgi:hypothetical protein